jgi:hypothetical protein
VNNREATEAMVQPQVSASKQLARANFPALGLLGTAVLLALILRLLIAVQDPLWLDEQHTAWSSHPGLDRAEVELRARLGNQQPLYFQLIQLLRGGLGMLTGNPDSALVLRLLSIFSGLAVLGLVCRLCYVWSGCWIATTLVAWVIALDQESLFYSSEARPYATLQLVGIFQILFFWCWIEASGIFNRQKRSACRAATKPSPLGMTGSSLGLLLSSLLIIQIHLTGVWLFLVELIWLICLLLIPWGTERPLFCSSRKWLVLFGLPVASVVGYFLMMAWWQNTETLDRKGNWQLISRPQELWNQLILQLGWLTSLILIVSLLNFYSGRLSERRKTEWDKDPIHWWRFCFVCLWSLVPLLSVLICEATGFAPLALKRYALIGSAGLALGSGLIVAMMRQPRAKLLLALTVTGITLAGQNWLQNGWQTRQLQFRYEDWESPIREIRYSQSRIPVLLFSNLIEDHSAFAEPAEKYQRYLQFPAQGIPGLDPYEFTIIPCPTLDFQELPESSWARIKPFEGTWLIIRGTEELRGAIIDRLVLEIQQRTAQPVLVTEAVFSSSGWSDVQLFRIDWKPADKTEHSAQGK